MRLVYDGPSLPMLDMNKEIFRVQILEKGQWRTFDSEEEYEKFIKDIKTFEYTPK